MTELLLLEGPRKPLPNKLSLHLAVPVGHPLSLGQHVTEAFSLMVEVGVRWHPDWTEPRIAVAAFRFLHQGDALCWSGDHAAQMPLPDAVAALVPFHGQPLGAENQALVDALGLAAPSSIEPMSAFVVKPVTFTIQ